MGEMETHSWPGKALFRAFPKDPEKEQAVLRITLGSVVLLAYLVACSIYRSTHVYATLVAVIAYVAFGVVTYVAVTVAPTRSRVRLTLFTFADQAIVTAALAAGGTSALPLLWVAFWFLVGAGCRYGQRMLGLSCVVALVGIMGLMHWQPWWRANLTAGLGIALSIVATSVYLAVLVYRLERQASTDPLTGLYNRVRLEQAIGRTLFTRGGEVERSLTPTIRATFRKAAAWATVTPGLFSWPKQ